MDIEKIEAGRAAVAQYRSTHEALHEQELNPEELAAGHEEIGATLRQELAEQGFNSLAEYEQDEEYLQVVEATEEMRALVLPEGGPLRFVDISQLTFYERCQIIKNAWALKTDDDIPDTVYFWAVCGLDKPIVRVTRTDAGNEIIARAEAKGVDAIIIEPSHSGRHRQYSYQNDTGLIYFIRERFADKYEARKAAYSVCLRVLEYLGAGGVTVRPGSNNFRVNGRKVAGGVATFIDGFYLMSTPITLNLDYELLQEIFADATISERVITLKEALGRETTVAELKAAALSVLPQVFNCDVNEEGLLEVETGALGG